MLGTFKSGLESLSAMSLQSKCVPVGMFVLLIKQGLVLEPCFSFFLLLCSILVADCLLHTHCVRPISFTFEHHYVQVLVRDLCRFLVNALWCVYLLYIAFVPTLLKVFQHLSQSQHFAGAVLVVPIIVVVSKAILVLCAFHKKKCVE